MNPLEALRDRIEGYKSQISEHLTAGGAKDHVAYAKAVSKFEGFDIVLRDIEEIEKRYLED
mgnify:CR=1 FL=1